MGKHFRVDSGDVPLIGQQPQGNPLPDERVGVDIDVVERTDVFGQWSLEKSQMVAAWLKANKDTSLNLSVGGYRPNRSKVSPWYSGGGGPTNIGWVSPKSRPVGPEGPAEKADRIETLDGLLAFDQGVSSRIFDAGRHNFTRVETSPSDFVSTVGLVEWTGARSIVHGIASAILNEALSKLELKAAEMGMRGLDEEPSKYSDLDLLLRTEHELAELALGDIGWLGLSYDLQNNQVDSRFLGEGELASRRQKFDGRGQDLRELSDSKGGNLSWQLQFARRIQSVFVQRGVAIESELGEIKEVISLNNSEIRGIGARSQWHSIASHFNNPTFSAARFPQLGVGDAGGPKLYDWSTLIEINDRLTNK